MMLPNATLRWLEDQADFESLRSILLVLAERAEGVEHLELLSHGGELSEHAMVRLLMALPGLESRHGPPFTRDFNGLRTVHTLDPVLRQSIRARYSASG